MQQFEKFTLEHTLLIDLDGTLIDTDNANFVSYQEAIRNILNIDIKNQTNDRFTRETIKKYIPTVSSLEFSQIIDLKNKLFLKNLHLTSLNISLVNLIKKYSKTNQIVLATNSHKGRVNILLEYHNISNYLKYIFCKEDYQKINEKSKIRYVLNKLKILPTSLFIFENEKCVIDDALIQGVPFENICYCSKGAGYEQI